jgi:hypothetical protein
MRTLWNSVSDNRFAAVYLTGLMLFAVGLPLSKTAISMALFLLSVHWLISGGFRNLPPLKSKRGMALAFFLLIIAIHLAGLAFTSDFRYAFKDLRIKAPLLLMPLFIASGPLLKPHQLRLILQVFVLAVFTGSLIVLYQQLVYQPVDPRDLTPFVSHIRFSMMVCLAVVIAWALLFTPSAFKTAKYSMLLPALWLPVALMMLQSLTGLVAAVLVTVVILFMGMLKHRKPWIRAASITLLIGAVASIMTFGLHLRREFQPVSFPEPSSLDSCTALGNPYFHDPASPLNENGNLIMIYLALDELKEAWNLRSGVSFDTSQPGGGTTGDVLIRYLTSLGLRKDAAAVNSLRPQDIAAIERGVTNHLYDEWSGLRRKTDQLKWEYWNYLGGGDARGHSLMQRTELWSAGFSLAQENLLTGVGTGDLKSAWAQKLQHMGSSLAGTPLRAHNQYLTILITFGIPGVLLFLMALFAPLIIQRKLVNGVAAAFLVIVFFSMLVEDTLETQVGVSFFAFFFALFLFPKVEKEP